jgi:hypothetical protein
MRRQSLCLCALALLAPIAHAQGPVESRGIGSPLSPPPGLQPGKTVLSLPELPAGPPAKLPADLLRPKMLDVEPLDPVTKFDPHAIEVRHVGQHWQLWSGKTMVKDFGQYRERAYDARRYIAELNLTERGAIGTPEPVMEYWLSNGEAPPLPSFSRNVIPFEPAALSVRAENGSYYVGNPKKLLFNFGPYAQDARQALAIIQKYGFNEISLIGAPNPSMTILLKNDYHSSGPDRTQNRVQLIAQMSPRHPLEIPGVGRVGESRYFDPMRLDISKAADGWHLTAGSIDLGLLGQSEYQARTAMQIAQRFPFTEQVRLGTGGFIFYLSNHQAPRGVPLGIRSAAFQPGLLTVKQAGNQWLVTDGKVALATTASAAEASQALAAVKHFGFNCSCEAGQGLKFLVLDR